MKNIIQMGSYGRNLGDSIALLNIRKSLNKLGKYKWTDLSYRLPLNPSLINSHDAIIVGGGGLIEGDQWGIKNGTHWKLPFTEDNIKKIKVPIIVFGVGLNFFRTRPKLSPKGIANLNALIHHAKFFSVRNDGSFQELQTITNTDKVLEVPDPGLITNKTNPVKTNLHKGFLGLSVNSEKILATRKISKKWMKSYASKSKLDLIPHTVDDVTLVSKKISNYRDINYFNIYNNYDFGICIRGHSQLIAFAKNIPTISLATQDKVLNFCKNYKLMEYCVDTLENDWESKLDTKVHLLKKDTDYVNDWYRISEPLISLFKTQYTSSIETINEILQA
jgi:polysaccharide pyruvyl transferase WcaK-like protein